MVVEGGVEDVDGGAGSSFTVVGAGLRVKSGLLGFFEAFHTYFSTAVRNSTSGIQASGDKGLLQLGHFIRKLKSLFSNKEFVTHSSQNTLEQQGVLTAARTNL